jgi:hypothetical protein
LTKQTTSLSLSKPEITDKIVDTITQLASNFDVIDLSLADGWARLNGAFSAASNVLTFVADGTATYPLVQQDTSIPFVTGHKIYACAKLATTNLAPTFYLKMQIRSSAGGTYVTTGQANSPILNTEYFVSGIATPTDGSGGTFRLKFEFGSSQNGTTVTIKEVFMVDLTAIFGAGNEPSVADFETLVKKYNANSMFINTVLTPNVFIGEAIKISDALNATLNNKLDKLSLSNPVLNSNFDDAKNWTFTLATGAVASNEMTFTANATFGQVKQPQTNAIVGHKYYIAAQVKAGTSNAKLQLSRSDTGARYIDILHSGSGNYEVLSGVGTADANVGIDLRVIDYRSSGWTPISFKQVVFLDLTAIFGAGNEPTKDTFEQLLKKYNANSLYFTTLKTLVALGETYPKPLSDNSIFPLYVTKNADVVNVVSKYNTINDLCVTLNKKGPNNIFDFSQWTLIPNTSNITTPGTSGTLMAINGTDMFGPYQVKATNNIDGDKPTSQDYTGGNHGYNNDANPPGTGRTTDIKLFIDGRLVDAFTGYCNYIDIYRTNRVQATNTKKADGTGREVLEENIHLHYDGYKWEANVLITFLEDVDLDLYYGMQTINSAWSDGVLYHGGTSRKWNTWAVDNNSGNKKCNKMTLKKGSDYLELGIDTSVDIGDFSLDTNTFSAFSKTYGKSYFNLVEGTKRFTAGDMVSYKGYYRFYSK